MVVFPLPERSEKISIHAPRGRGDVIDTINGIMIDDISIHAPRGRGDQVPGVILSGKIGFQSTPLAGGATRALLWGII